MSPAEGPVRGRVDREGRLVVADPVLAALHRRAGGEVRGPLAIPQLAQLARLARRLAVPVSRAVLAADGEEDLDLWVRARPDEDGVTLAIAGWTRRAPSGPLPAEEGADAFDRLRAEADWTWETDGALRLIALSEEGVRAMRGAAGPALGDPLSRLMILEEGAQGGPPLLDALAQGRGFEDQRVTVRASGARFRLAAVPLHDGLGRLTGFRGTATALPAAPATPVVADGAFSQRLDTALRGPLQRIVAAAESIRLQQDGPLRADYGGYAGDIATAGRHLLGLVGDLVDLDAVEREDFATEREPLDLADCARRAAGLLAVRADDRAIQIVRPDPQERCLALGDFGRCLQVLVNLIGNAVRFGPEGSTVTVTVERTERGAAAIVIDEGRGIAPADRARVFEKFERLGASEPGSGLGLYISRRLARAMGGDIVVEDGIGPGARLVFTLPPAEA
ncbi:sensor histidine kinase [Sphingomonas morindae]|uniref:histidine kinase n=1 Tax=Sphingomonas morindae TaxID=1541170 RepID=A0ABY4X4I1_9SPHN|nr:HAMP domain-containing sensor histidine kinase [Sphingomonas morindae]USI71765.1 HAMP domain-containing histidine kinase [Sphingomonas morindae]